MLEYDLVSFDAAIEQRKLCERLGHEFDKQIRIADLQPTGHELRAIVLHIGHIDADVIGHSRACHMRGKHIVRDCPAHSVHRPAFLTHGLLHRTSALRIAQRTRKIGCHNAPTFFQQA